MKKRNLFFGAIFLLILTFIAEVAHFTTEVKNELWINSIRTITESTHQGANALNMQFEMDFDTLHLLWEQISTSDTPETMSTLYKGVEPDIVLYRKNTKNRGGMTEVDQNVNTFLDKNDIEQGILDSHICTVTGDSVFNIFVKGTLADGTTAYLVKEYFTKEIAEQFTLSFYDNIGFSYLINQNGVIMVRPRHKNGNKTIYNIFDMISKNENDAQEIHAFRQSIQNLETSWAKFNSDGQGLVFCYEPLKVDSTWLLVSIVPENVITAQAKSVVRKTIVFSVISLLTILCVIAIFHGFKMQERQIHTQELTAALNIADSANRAKGRFLMDMSHDIRTPLNAIIGMVSIAQDNISDQSKLKDCLEKINSSSTHLLSLISDILDMSQIEKGKIILKEEAISLPQLFEQTVEVMQPIAQEAHLNLEMRPIQLENNTIIGDSLRIRQILLNIIRNAVKYTQPGGHITLELTQAEHYQGLATYRFRCIDTGIGMNQEFMERIFLPFERDRNTTDSKVAGMGVGLTITKKLLDLMGGTISVESELQKGSIFTIEFHFMYQDSNFPIVQVEEEPDYSNRRVLLVEDNELNMEILEELLGITNIHIEKAYDGQQAVSMVTSQPPHYYNLIFMDIQMPVMDGYEAARQLRNMDRDDLHVIPIVAVSANALASDVENALIAGMNGHIPKPVDLDELIGTLQQYL